MGRAFSLWVCGTSFSSFVFFNVPATTEIYTLSLHDALPILASVLNQVLNPIYAARLAAFLLGLLDTIHVDRKSTRLNSSHVAISYAVFCLKKKTLGCVSRPRRTSIRRFTLLSPLPPRATPLC